MDPSVAVGRDALDAVSSLGIPSALGCWGLNTYPLAWREWFSSPLSAGTSRRRVRVNWTYGVIQCD